MERRGRLRALLFALFPSQTCSGSSSSVSPPQSLCYKKAIVLDSRWKLWDIHVGAIRYGGSGKSREKSAALEWIVDGLARRPDSSSVGVAVEGQSRQGGRLPVRSLSPGARDKAMGWHHADDGGMG